MSCFFTSSSIFVVHDTSLVYELTGRLGECYDCPYGLPYLLPFLTLSCDFPLPLLDFCMRHGREWTVADVVNGMANVVGCDCSSGRYFSPTYDVYCWHLFGLFNLPLDSTTSTCEAKLI